ncbi:hypothetical protein P692DRAFT_2064486 [Suillus brevipes Sb2]|nr:hypothetical protein P692DRAFT_2064486 [Suillus brevipes Sb2]
MCELPRRKPQHYLPLALQLFHLLTTSSNNWMLIRIVKLFGSLSPHEPRLVKKLQPPITDLISTTSTISLLYECNPYLSTSSRLLLQSPQVHHLSPPPTVLSCHEGSCAGVQGSCSEVLWAAAWICGEYCSELSAPD